jgi:hypothetical protein
VYAHDLPAVDQLPELSLQTTPSAIADRGMAASNWLSRYRGGERAQVWHELRQLGAEVRHPAHLVEATAVCDEMAIRARHNIELLVHRLTSEGYRFHANDDAQGSMKGHMPPSDNAEAHARWLVDRFGAVPLTVTSWIRLVGDVWFVGTHPDWDGAAAADPLVIELEGCQYPDASIRQYYDESFSAWTEYRAQSPAQAGLFELPVAPDRLHKQNVSGGAPYGFVLPDSCADGLFVAETTTPFVSYLNSVFKTGGFPCSTSDSSSWRVRSRLAQDLLPL